MGVDWQAIESEFFCEKQVEKRIKIQEYFIKLRGLWSEKKEK